MAFLVLHLCPRNDPAIALQQIRQDFHALCSYRTRQYSAHAPAAATSRSVPAEQAQLRPKGTQLGLAKRCSLPLSLSAVSPHSSMPPPRQACVSSNPTGVATCNRLSGTSPLSAWCCMICLQACIFVSMCGAGTSCASCLIVFFSKFQPNCQG